MNTLAATVGLIKDLAFHCQWAKPQAGRLLVVGGAVRDRYWEQAPISVKDFDLEVYGMSYECLIALLEQLGLKFDTVGRAFSVVKLMDYPVDISLPRRERKTGDLHTDFEVEADSTLSIEEACERRDFTINAISYDPVTRQVIDPYNGMADMQAGILRPTSARFKEDPLRVLRAAQFIARYNLEPTYRLIKVCEELTDQFNTLSKERVFEEWNKLLLKGRSISAGIQFLDDCGWLKHFPELAALKGVPQDPIWHPEGCCLTHTKHCLDAFARNRTGNDNEDLLVGYAVLGHDFGKATHTTTDEHGKIHAYGHEEASGPLLESFLKRLTNQTEFINQAVRLAQAHMRPVNLYNDRAGLSAIRRLALFVGRIDLLMRVVRADQEGRPPLPANHINCTEWMLQAARTAEVESSKPKPIVMGRHLIKLGLQPGKVFSQILDRCFEAQVDGVFADQDGGCKFAAQLIQTMSLDGLARV
ncbi:MAG: polynucleotide adenylyltransferase [Nitrosomonadaceae bacterium]|nr:polynucleotide adenylyltransferase [Nitrosomonadaceae bacterium]